MSGNARLGDKCAQLGIMPLGDATSCDGGGLPPESITLTTQVITVADQQMGLEYGTVVPLTPQIIHVAERQAEAEYDVTLELPTQEIAVSSGNPTPVVATEVTLTPQLLTVEEVPGGEFEQTIDQIFTLTTQHITIEEGGVDSLYDVTVELPTQELRVSSGNPNPVVSVSYDVELTLNPQTIQVATQQFDLVLIDHVIALQSQEVLVFEHGSSPLIDVSVELPTQEIVVCHAMTGGSVIVPSDCNFTEVMRSAACQVIMGVSSNPFKLNPGTMTYRRQGRAHNLHTGRKVKPVVVTVEAEFVVVTPTAELEAGDFLYRSTDGYLQITNVDPINITLVADDVDSDAILIDPKPIPPNTFQVFTSLPLARIPHTVFS